MKEHIFYYFLNRAIDDTVVRTPMITSHYLGDVGDYVEVDGAGYYVRDYAVEDCYQDEYLRY